MTPLTLTEKRLAFRDQIERAEQEKHMSIKHFYVVTCDGPCGTVLEKSTAKTPDDWRFIQVHRVHPEAGKSNMDLKIILCPKCQKRLSDWMQVSGFVTESRPENKDSGEAA